MSWNVPLLHEIFLPHDIKMIIKIPLSMRRSRDILVWTGTSKGVFTVRSAYHMLLHCSVADQAESSSSKVLTRFWQRLWSVQVAPKKKLFIWRACRNILPTQAKLYDKGITSSLTCRWCMDEAETVDHVLWGCEFAQKVWVASAVHFSAGMDSTMSFMEVMDHCFTDLQFSRVEIFFTTAWALWQARNVLFWEDKVLTVSDVVLRGAESSMNFIEAGNIEDVMQLVPIELGPPKWEPPTGDIFKLNIASQCNGIQRREGLGIIIRNHVGLVMASMSCSFEMLEDKVQSHARMVLKALQFVKAIGMSRVIVEGCWQDLFRLLRTTGPCLANSGVLVDEILC